MTALKISLLGGLEVGAGDGAQATAITRKAGALVAFLALQGGHAQSREKLASLFWSRNTDEQARTNLRQALSRLRKALANGEDGPLIAEPDRVRLDMAQVELDVARFEKFVAARTPESLEAASTLYRGDLLDGINLNEEGFDIWLRGERERLRTLAAGSLENLSSHYESARDMERSIQAAARLVALDPLRESGHRTLMRAYAAQGRHGLALKQYKSCAEILARELGVQPDAETQAQYREILKKRDDRETGGATPARLERVAATAETLEGTGAVVLDLPDRPSVAVLPFESTANGSEPDYFADGITENVITGLTRNRDLFVIAPKTIFKARSLAGDPREAGAELGVAHIVEGSVRRAGDRVRVTARLMNAANGQQIWAEQYDRDLEDVFGIQDEIAEHIVATLAGRIEESGRRRAARKAPGDITAFDYLLRARPLLNSYTKDGILESRRLLEKALEIDPGLAGAWAELARNYQAEYETLWTTNRRAALERARELAEKAIALDGADTVARYALANVYFYSKRYELAKAEIERALEINPTDYHNLCSKGWFLVFMGRVKEGMACSREAMRCTPFAPDNCMLIAGFGEYSERRYDAAIAVLNHVSAQSVWRDSFLAASYAQLGRLGEARAVAAEIRKAATEVRNSENPETWRAYWANWLCYQDSGEMEHFMEGLRKAGLPA